jgi:hypothetical protein
MKYMIMLIMIVGLCANLFAQQGYGGITWNIASPAEETKDFIDETSYRGFGIEFRTFLTNNISFGGQTGWNIMDQRIDGTIELERGTVTGTQIRHINSFPILANLFLHLGSPRAAFRPYLGVNVGTYFIIQRLELGIFAIEENNWHFGVAPEVGILFPTDYLSVMASLKYNRAFEAGTSITGDAKGFDYWGLNIGFLFPTY